MAKSRAVGRRVLYKVWLQLFSLRVSLETMLVLDLRCEASDLLGISLQTQRQSP